MISQLPSSKVISVLPPSPSMTTMDAEGLIIDFDSSFSQDAIKTRYHILQKTINTRTMKNIFMIHFSFFTSHSSFFIFHFSFFTETRSCYGIRSEERRVGKVCIFSC